MFQSSETKEKKLIPIGRENYGLKSRAMQGEKARKLRKNNTLLGIKSVQFNSVLKPERMIL